MAIEDDVVSMDRPSGPRLPKTAQIALADQNALERT